MLCCQRSVEVLLQRRQFFEGQLLIEVSAHGARFGGARQIPAYRFEGFSTGTDGQEGFVEVLTLAAIALGLKRQMGLENGAGRVQGLRVGQFWGIVFHGLVWLWIVR